jgi:Tfp pilus assembly protein PilO
MVNFKKALYINILIVAVILTGAFFLTSYLQKEITKKSEEIYKYKSDLALYVASLSNLAKLKEVSPKADLYLIQLNKLMPSRDRLIDLPGFIGDFARANQVQVNFSFRGGGKNPEDNSPGFENFSIDINGYMNNILNFLNATEESGPQFILNLGSFNLNQTSQGIYRFSSDGSVFYLK